METSYRAIRDSLDTGDLILFSGKGGISAGIKWATFSDWSHIGMVLKIKEFDFITVWESTTLSDIPDLVSGKERQGVQLVPLSARVNSYDGSIAVRKLQGVDRNSLDIKDLMEFRREVSRRPYEKNKIELIKSAYDGPFGHNKEDLSSLFCSELVAEAYQRLGLLDPQLSSNEFTPSNFAEKKDKSKEVQLLQGMLSAEILLKDDSD